MVARWYAVWEKVFGSSFSSLDGLRSTNERARFWASLISRYRSLLSSTDARWSPLIPSLCLHSGLKFPHFAPGLDHLTGAWIKLHSSMLGTFFVYTLTLSMPIFTKKSHWRFLEKSAKLFIIVKSVFYIKNCHFSKFEFLHFLLGLVVNNKHFEQFGKD